MALSHEDVREILRIIDETMLEELAIETEGFSLHVRKRGAAGDDEAAPIAARHASPALSPIATAPAPDAGEDLVTIPAPMLGTFYRAESPGSAPFVELGARVEPDTTVCIIEVMKMMNSVSAGVSGTVVEVCSPNAALVEYGEPLFRVRAGGAG
jgi:acetyl-CoA carboxylase biotin carboxyl carrier protein